jgi:ATP-dependent exoDNAse (exonuclease V) beta subunit
LLKSQQQVKQVSDLAHRGLHHKQVQDWFSGRYQLFNECNILIPDADTGKLLKRRPDRVMMSDERIIVVDFKFGRPIEDYKTQVQKYMNILQSMYPAKQVEGWLWYVYKNRTEEVKMEE